MCDERSTSRRRAKDSCGDDDISQLRTHILGAGRLPGVAEDPSQLLNRLSDFLGKHQTDERGCAITVAPADGLRDRIKTFVVHHGSSLLPRPL